MSQRQLQSVPIEQLKLGSPLSHLALEMLSLKVILANFAQHERFSWWQSQLSGIVSLQDLTAFTMVLTFWKHDSVITTDPFVGECA